MRVIREHVQTLRSVTFREAARLVFRKAVYRKVTLRRYGGRAGSTRAPDTGSGLEIDFLDPGSAESVLAANPYLDEVDLSLLSEPDSTCVVVRRAGRVVASCWMVRGDILVRELSRKVEVRDHEHYVCRGYVEPEQRGRSLFGHMIRSYCQRIEPDHHVWALVYPWNVASIRSLERIGWQYSGDYRTTFLAGIRFASQDLHQTTPPSVDPEG